MTEPLPTACRASSCSSPTTAPTPSCTSGGAKLGAKSGKVHAGPFGSNHGFWAQPQGTKFWVGSDRDTDHPTGATIRTSLLGQPHAGSTTHRRADQIASVSNMAIFYPGALRLPEPGEWRITVTIGPDTGCFLVHTTR